MDLSQNSPVHGADTLKTTTAYQRLIKKIELFDVLPETAFVDNKLVYVVCDRSPSSIQRDVKAGRLAPPIKIGPNAVRFRVGDVRSFLTGVETEIDQQVASKFSEAS